MRDRTIADFILSVFSEIVSISNQRGFFRSPHCNNLELGILWMAERVFVWLKWTVSIINKLCLGNQLSGADQICFHCQYSLPNQHQLYQLQYSRHSAPHLLFWISIMNSSFMANLNKTIWRGTSFLLWIHSPLTMTAFQIIFRVALARRRALSLLCSSY